jgi:hypothetical protein
VVAVTREELADALTVERFTHHQRTTKWVSPKPPPKADDRVLAALDELAQAARRRELQEAP